MRVRKRLGDTAQGFYSPYYLAWLRAVISQAFAAQLMEVLKSEEHPTTIVKINLYINFNLGSKQNPPQVHHYHQDRAISKMSFSRTNNATEVAIDANKIFASGTFKNVWQGDYTDGARKGELCVAKEFKSGSVFQSHYFEEELEIIRHSQAILGAFAAARVIRVRILLNIPEVWVYDETGENILVEPMIENFEKFNSNTGWAPRTGDAWSEAMQALSHFSYHDSNQKFLLCDLQGGSYRDG
jgi:hypothetical protein